MGRRMRMSGGEPLCQTREFHSLARLCAIETSSPAKYSMFGLLFQ